MRDAIYIEELPYRQDSCDWFAPLRDLAEPLFLDSCFPHSRQGRFDILLADPIEKLHFSTSKSTSYNDIVKYFLELERALDNVARGPEDTLPFCGGLAGYIDYEIGLPLQYLPALPGARARVNLYDWALVQDHLLGRCLFVSLPGMPSPRRTSLLERLREPVAAESSTFALQRRFDTSLDRAAYGEAFRQVQQYIHAGDCYQVNLARRFSAAYSGDPWSAYRALRPIAAAPFSAFMDGGESRLLCMSPERFLRVAGQHVETRPIKGTRPRQGDPAADVMAAEELRKSEKDRAENLMIVDLLRNDIGRNCRPGSIQVDALFELESYPSVHHLVSTISGELSDSSSALRLLRDCFPGGSITGAPKRRAMEIITELEPDSRRAYCGTVFYASADGRMDSNIAIRSMLCEDGNVHCWGGGGLVADSRCESEYRETWDKVGRFIEALESLMAEASP